MTKWTDFVRDYAKRNNVTYMCAIPDAAKEYKTLPKTVKTRKSTPKTVKTRKSTKKVKLVVKESAKIPTIVDESKSFMQRTYLTV